MQGRGHDIPHMVFYNKVPVTLASLRLYCGLSDHHIYTSLHFLVIQTRKAWTSYPSSLSCPLPPFLFLSAFLLQLHFSAHWCDFERITTLEVYGSMQMATQKFIPVPL